MQISAWNNLILAGAMPCWPWRAEIPLHRAIPAHLAWSRQWPYPSNPELHIPSYRSYTPEVVRHQPPGCPLQCRASMHRDQNGSRRCFHSP
ncbi:uncharacterized protein LOC142590114 isoform X3 [Dermacentor variabilis]|uniref:uncharacterized protein LOC142590114 isoform X3 n=1 Tax=Dermacentor variabilis TaxID=34621 RepID=UPI003F5C1CCD